MVIVQDKDHVYCMKTAVFKPAKGAITARGGRRPNVTSCFVRKHVYLSGWSPVLGQEVFEQLLRQGTVDKEATGWIIASEATVV